MAGLEDIIRSTAPGGNIGKPLMLALLALLAPRPSSNDGCAPVLAERPAPPPPNKAPDVNRNGRAAAD